MWVSKSILSGNTHTHTNFIILSNELTSTYFLCSPKSSVGALSSADTAGQLQ